MAMTWYEFRDHVSFDEAIELTSPELVTYFAQVLKLAVSEFGMVAGVEVYEDLREEVESSKLERMQFRVLTTGCHRKMRAAAGRKEIEKNEAASEPRELTIQEYLALKDSKKSEKEECL